MSAMPEIPELKDSDFGWECPTCRTKIGKSFLPIGTCACGQPWIVLDAEGQRTAETFPVPVPARVVIGECCQFCGMTNGFHGGGCAIWKAEQPPVYDLAEFERQLEQQMGVFPVGHGSLTNVTYGALLLALRASKREAK